MATENVSYYIDDKMLLDRVTIKLIPGKMHVLIGPNGAGKSTLLRLLSGDIAPTSGTVLLGNEKLQKYSKRDLALRRSVMPQEVTLSLAFTGEEVVMMGRYPHTDKQTPRDHDAAIVKKMMRLTESEAFRQRLYPTLSGGEQARVTLARVLAQETDLLLLDEPTANLDPRHQHLVMHLARRHARQGGTVLAVLHDLNLTAAYSDCVFLLGGGALHAQGPPKEVLQPSILGEVFQTEFLVVNDPGLPHPAILSYPASE